MTPINPHSHLHSALLLYEQTRFDDIQFPAPRILTQSIQNYIVTLLMNYLLCRLGE